MPIHGRKPFCYCQKNKRYAATGLAHQLQYHLKQLTKKVDILTRGLSKLIQEHEATKEKGAGGEACRFEEEEEQRILKSNPEKASACTNGL